MTETEGAVNLKNERDSSAILMTGDLDVDWWRQPQNFDVLHQTFHGKPAAGSAKSMRRFSPQGAIKSKTEVVDAVAFVVMCSSRMAVGQDLRVAAKDKRLAP